MTKIKHLAKRVTVEIKREIIKKEPVKIFYTRVLGDLFFLHSDSDSKQYIGHTYTHNFL